MRWPHVVTISRITGSVTQDLTTGVPTVDPDDTTVIYEGMGDLQHTSRTNERNIERDPNARSEAQLFLEDESDLWSIQIGDTARMVDRATSVAMTARVRNVDHLSGRLYLEQVQAA